MTLSDIRDRVLTRIEADPTDAAWQFVGTCAINEGQRIFAFLSLCLENTRELILTPGDQAFNILAQWTDWFVPLRVRISNDTTAGVTSEFDAMEGNAGQFNEQAYPGLTVTGTPKLRPQSIYQMAANDPNWLNNSGVPTRYGMAGWDFLHLDKSPNLAGLKLLITYARCPVPLVKDSDVPEILEADHEALVSYGIARLRANEGGAELENATELINGFLDAAAARFEEVKSRSMAQGYDWPTVELNPAVRQNPQKKKR